MTGRSLIDDILADLETQGGDPHALDPDDVSDDALAVAMMEQALAPNAHFVPLWGRWLFWEGARWEPDDLLRHMTLTREWARNAARVLRQAADDADSKTAAAIYRKRALTVGSASTISGIEKLARSHPGVALDPEDLDSHLDLIATPGGTVDLRTGEMRPSRREDLFTMLTRVTPAPPGTPAPMWTAFLNRVQDPETIDLLQRWIGYGLTGLTTEHRVLFCWGAGRNGKGVVMNTTSALAGDYAKTAPSAIFLQQRTEGHPTEVAGLKGKRMVIASELPEGATWNETRLKALTGGDRLSARFMRQDFFDFDPQLTLTIVGNSKPALRGVDPAARDRMLLVPFSAYIRPEERDPDLQAKLLAREGPAILRWMIDGAVKWFAEGLSIPASIAAVTQEYLDGEDIVGGFLADLTEPGEASDRISRAALYAEFRRWRDRQGLTGGWSAATFYKDLAKRGLDQTTYRGDRCYRGIRFRFRLDD